MSDIVEHWKWRDPEEVAERAEEREASRAKWATQLQPTERATRERDRYYTQARRLHVKQLMKGRL